MIKMKLGTGSNKGFTLIEVLVVLVIIGIIASAASLQLVNYNNSRSSTITAINLLRSRILFAQQQALLLNKTLGLAIGEKSYQFMEYIGINFAPGWQVLTDRSLAKQAWPSQFSLQLGLKGELPNSLELAAPMTPQIIFSASGEVTLFTLYINKYFILSSNDASEITLKTLP